jgi:hypothetical protein
MPQAGAAAAAPTAEARPVVFSSTTTGSDRSAHTRQQQVQRARFYFQLSHDTVRHPSGTHWTHVSSASHVYVR